MGLEQKPVERWGDSTVGAKRRAPGHTRKLFKQETLSQEEHFAEGDKARAEQYTLEYRLPAVGGPMDGLTMRVPVDLFRKRVPLEVPVSMGDYSTLDAHGRPIPRPERAVYRLDHASRAWRYVTTRNGV